MPNTTRSAKQELVNDAVRCCLDDWEANENIITEALHAYLGNWTLKELQEYVTPEDSRA